MNNIAIGFKISETRKKRGYSIREFAKRVDLSAALLSQIERGLANPSLNTLRMIADGLNIPLYTLFIDEIKHELLILRKEDRQTIDRNPDNVVFDVPFTRLYEVQCRDSMGSPKSKNRNHRGLYAP